MRDLRSRRVCLEIVDKGMFLWKVEIWCLSLLVLSFGVVKSVIFI
jgi:hypothetical protein